MSGKSLSILVVVVWGLLTMSSPAQPPATPQYKAEFRIYEVGTNITGNGLTSQTMLGVNGSFQIVHEKLDDLELVMEGPVLTWNGKPEPDYRHIQAVSKPTLVTLEGQTARITVGEKPPAQYFVRREDGCFELRSLAGDDPNEVLGLEIRFTPRRISEKPGELSCGFKFRYSWIQDRESIPGVDLNVGKPIVSTESVEGTLGARLNEWTCYRAFPASRGAYYVFVRVTEETPNSAREISKPSGE